MKTTDLLKNPMIKKALDNFIPKRHNLEPRVRDKRPSRFIKNEFSIMQSPLYGMKVQIGEILINKIKEELGVK